MPGPYPRTRSKPEKREAPESPKDPKLEGEKKLPKEPEKQTEAPIGALGSAKKIAGAKQAEDIVRAAVRDRGKDQSLAKGGRAMYKSGMRVCKLAKRGKGRAYGKNS